MASAAILNHEPREPVPEFEGENRREGEESASGDERTRRVETESKNRNNGHSASQEPNPSSDNELKLMVSEVVDKLGPLSDEEAKIIREWLELGSG